MQDAHELIIRAAKFEDIPSIIDLGMKCFPLDVNHQLPWKLQENWLSLLIRKNFAELYVAKSRNITAGYAIITPDYTKYQEEESRRERPFFAKFLAMVKSPPLIYSVIHEKAILIRDGSAFWKQKVLDKGKEPARDGMLLVQLAVNPKCQRKGFGSTILKYVERRALYYGRSSVFLAVLPNNKGAISLYEVSGYHYVGRTSKWLSYRKVVQGMGTMKGPFSDEEEQRKERL